MSSSSSCSPKFEVDENVVFQQGEIEKGTAWHCPSGGANTGTVHAAASMQMDHKKMFFFKNGYGSLCMAPFMIDDPLCLTHPPKVRHIPDFKEKRNMLAAAEWWNVLPSFDGVLAGGMSLNFFMAAVNIKVVHASSLVLIYGPNFRYYERWAFLGFRAARALGIFSAIPVLRERKVFRSAVYYLLNSIDRRTSLEIREFTLPWPDPFWQAQDRGGFGSTAYGTLT